MTACNVATGWGDTAARVFDQRTDDQVSANLSWFGAFHEFTITVVYHDKSVWIAFFDLLDDFLNVGNKERIAERIAAGTLNVSHFCTFYSSRDGVKINFSFCGKV